MRLFLASAVRALLELYPKGISLLWLAPGILALVVIPEFAQHVAEIRLGMFDSTEAFRAHQLDASRMAFGYAKVAGLLAAMLAAARYWMIRGSDRRWWDLRHVAWWRLGLGFVIFFGIGSLPELLPDRMDRMPYQALGWAWMIATLPGLFIMLAGLSGDRQTPLSAMWTKAWPWIVLTMLLAALGFGPAAWLHQMNHAWASGAGPVLLWSLMAWDSLLVGLIAALAGTGLGLGYCAFRNSPGPRALANP